MLSILVGASHTFLLGFSLDTESEMRRWDMVPSVWSTARVSEARCYFTGDISRLKHYFHYESHIDKPRNWWQATLESGRTVHTFSLVIRIHWLNQEYIYIEKPHAHLRPNCNNTSKKDWNCARLRRAEHLLPQYPTLSDIIWLSLSNSYHTKP